MPNIKAFVNKMKEKGKKYKAEQNEKKAKAKGFSSHRSYETFSSAAKYEGEEKAKSTLRKKELKKIKSEAEQDVLAGRSGKYHKYQKKIIKGMESVQKGAGVYNEMIGGLQSLGAGNNDSMFPQPAPRKTSNKRSKKRKPQQTKSKSRNKKSNNFWDQFY